MKYPILLILFSHIGFILMIENNILDLDDKIIFLIMDLTVSTIILKVKYTTRYTKIGVILVLKIIIFYNLFNYYEIIDPKEKIIFPKRELTLEVNIGNNISNTKYYNNYKKVICAKITSAPTVKNNLVGENIFCLVDHSEKTIFSDVDITIKGVLCQKTMYKKYIYELDRCTIISAKPSRLNSSKLTARLNLFLQTSFMQFKTINPEIRGFLHAVFLGDKTLLTNEQLNIFRKSGTLHLFAVSGLHIGFLYLIFKYLFIFIFHKRLIVEIFVSIILLIYLEVIAYPPSAIRACIMIFFWQLSCILFKKKNAFSSLCWSCLLVLIVNPSSILSIGFQLSYTVVLTILVFNYHIYQNSDHSIPSFSSFLKNSLIVSYSSFCGSLLLIYDHFDIIVPVSIIINILAIPITFIFIIFIFSMLILQKFIDVQIFAEIFLMLYNLLNYLINLFSLENLSFFFIPNKIDLNDFVHFLYPIFFLIYFTMVKSVNYKVIGHLLLPFILITLFSYFFI